MSTAVLGSGMGGTPDADRLPLTCKFLDGFPASRGNVDMNAHCQRVGGCAGNEAASSGDVRVAPRPAPTTPWMLKGH